MIIDDIRELFGHLEKGRLQHDLGMAVNEVTEHLALLGGGTGTVTLTLSFTAKQPLLDIKGEIKTTLPKAKRKNSIAFLTQDGRISLQHPDQQPLPLGNESFSNRRAAAETIEN
jgi:hypothetical protein